MIRINAVSLALDEPLQVLKTKAAKALRIGEEEIREFRILKESVDARGSEVRLTYSIMVRVDGEERVLGRNRSNKDVSAYQEEAREPLNFGTEALTQRPVIVGLGPAGLFAGLLLAQHGYRPLIVERGQDVDSRTKTVDDFMQGGPLDTESNIQFGEGGAGAFSDGKLTTRIKDQRVKEVLDALIRAGAPEEIAYLSKPHVGTDLLKGVVKTIRERIIALGGEVVFSEKLKDVRIRNGRLESIMLASGEIPCSVLILAIGHSSRDTYQMLFDRGVAIESKPMAMGVRVENLQTFIDRSQYGEFSGHPRLKAAEYKLTAKLSDGRGAYSFCMCPGGYVVPAASEDGRLVVNGMSYHAREGRNANSAIVVSVTPKDFGEHPLDGIAFQREIESAAFREGGGGYTAPVQLVRDFLEGKVSKDFEEVTPSYVPGVGMRKMDKILPSFITSGLKEGFRSFDTKIKGFTTHGAIITGVETRTSAPLRIMRNAEHESINVRGIFPTGEGAGYAGGIISAAVDGMKAAESVMRSFRPL